MAAKPIPHQAVENRNRALWDDITPVHPKAYKEVALLREGGRGARRDRTTRGRRRSRHRGRCGFGQPEPSSFPERADGDCVEPVSESGTRLAVVQHDSCRKAPSCRLLQLAQSAEILARHRCRGFDLDAGQFVGGTFEHKVHFVAILVAEVAEVGVLAVPTGLPTQFLEDEGFKNVTKDLAVACQGLDIEAQQ